MSLIVELNNALQIARQDREYVQALFGIPCRITLQVLSSEGDVTLPAFADGDISELRLAASEAVWQQIMQPIPPVGLHSFTAALRQEDRFSVVGDALHIAQCLHALERLFEILRGQIEDRPDAMSVDLSSISGHYAALLLGKNVVPLYYETSGASDLPCLVMLHTAGADSRQYHAIMSDSELQQQWHMHAFDMPGHGRSAPLADTVWQGYRLDKQTYADICTFFLRNILGKPAVLIGCSMGAAIALHVAREAFDVVLGAVALEAPFRAKGRRTNYLAHAQVNQAAHNPSYVRGLMSPVSPLNQRRQAAWIYSGGGFQIYSGDLAFYSDEFDAEVDIRGLDGTARPIYLLTGAYDYSATPADSRKVADLIPGAQFVEMSDLGHFPMTEHPKALLGYLKPVLQEIKARIGSV